MLHSEMARILTSPEASRRRERYGPDRSVLGGGFAAAHWFDDAHQAEEPPRLPLGPIPPAMASRCAYD